jgi:CBS domain containing-hemolysin-like protein
MLTLAEAKHVETEQDDTLVPILAQTQILNVLATRLGWLIALFAICRGWLSVSHPAYHALRAWLALSRTEASFTLLWLPMALVAGGTLWFGHLVGRGRYKILEERPWLMMLLLPLRYLAMPIQLLAQVLVHTRPDTTEVGLRALSGSPDAFWQMVQDQAGRDGDATNKQIFDKATELQSIRVRACMTNRTDIVGFRVAREA